MQYYFINCISFMYNVLYILATFQMWSHKYIFLCENEKIIMLLSNLVSSVALLLSLNCISSLVLLFTLYLFCLSNRITLVCDKWKHILSRFSIVFFFLHIRLLSLRWRIEAVCMGIKQMTHIAPFFFFYLCIAEY